ncbi:hypothetical protein LS482_08505 [Sinomicrobium kalidii]|uniref:hypothetical protein n=1 Tax=Sinomicrobium kalidii TaxID=2900738 RepID=UPI001E559E29|nr:hypothetical protein [Sinomicrobium kalidii]UGU17907.1 hypothetical protein LS482_08505 [Sinomicrobium kalidii]
MKGTILLFLMIPLVFYAQTNTFPASGNVGIGTTNPVSKLEVNGDISLTRTRKIKFLETINGEDRAYIRSTYGQNGEDYNSLVFAVRTGEESMMIKSNGNVGVGTMHPDSKLAVNGIVHSKEVKVDLNDWSDFVFKKGYNLPVLEEVEQHIKEKGHLKDIPSAKEVAKNGIFLGEMDARLLQKIEELTLYIIKQDKQIKKLKEENTRISVLEEKLDKLLRK